MTDLSSPSSSSLSVSQSSSSLSPVSPNDASMNSHSSLHESSSSSSLVQLSNSSSFSSGVEVSQMDQKQAEYMMKDRCILVNRKDEPIGSAAKQECHLNTVIRAGKGLHRAFSVFLFNTRGELLLQRRALTKPTFPGRWTNTCCSHPLFDTEESREDENHTGVKLAAIRKLDDELGIKGVKIEEFNWLTRVHYCAMSDGKWGEHEIDHLMFLRGDFELSPNPDEVCEVSYVTPDQLRQHFAIAAQQPDHLTPWFQMIAEELLFGWWENGALDTIMKQGGLEDPSEKTRIRELCILSKPDTIIPKETP